jgi:hypothetical protein
MKQRGPGRSWLLGTGLTIAATLGITVLCNPISAQPPDNAKKLKKQIEVMERILDELLVDSPNFLVSSRNNNTHGVYLDGFGVLLAFDASLIQQDDQDIWQKLGKKFKIYTKDGQTVIDLNADEDDDGKDDEEAVFDHEKWREQHEKNQQELYEHGKAELVEGLMDYGETLTTLRDGDTVAIAAFLRDADFFTRNEISTLVIKAKMSDLRAYSSGSINEKTMRSRIIQEEN